MKDRFSRPGSLFDYRMADFAALPHQAPFAERAALERQGVRMEGWVQRVLLSGDGDLHLELAEHRRTALDRDTVYVVGEITPQWRYRTRGWDYDSLLVAFRPEPRRCVELARGPGPRAHLGLAALRPPLRQAVNNWMLHREAVRLTGWEIHPVTNIECWDDASLSWQELSR